MFGFLPEEISLRSTAWDDSSFAPFSWTILLLASSVPNSPISHGLQTSVTHRPLALRVTESFCTVCWALGPPGSQAAELALLCGSAALNAAVAPLDTFVPRVVKSLGLPISQTSATIARTIQIVPSATRLARRRIRPHQASHNAPRMTTHDQYFAPKVLPMPRMTPSTVFFNQPSSDSDAAAW